MIQRIQDYKFYADPLDVNYFYIRKFTSYTHHIQYDVIIYGRKSSIFELVANSCCLIYIILGLKWYENPLYGKPHIFFM